MGGASLHKKTSSGPHRKTAVGDLLRLETFELGGIALAEAKGIKAEVTGSALTGLTAGGGGDTANHLNDRDHDKAKGDVLGVGVPQLPEGIHLALGGGGLAAGRGAEDLDLEDTSDGEHGNTAVLDLGLTEPVEVDTDLINIGKTEGVETDVAGHRSIELLCERIEIHCERYEESKLF